MDSPNMTDGQKRRRLPDHYQTKHARDRSPRLPTPEDSGSNSDAFDGHSSTGTALSIRNLLSHPASGDKTAYMGAPKYATDSRRDSRNLAGPYSPPYRTTDLQKPSLPPIKTVLGDSISSPPRTPSPIGKSLQPSPREPSYTASTYKPPSLYPNKKARTDSYMTSAPFHPGSKNALSSPLPPSSTLGPRAAGPSMRPNVQYPPLTAAIDSIDMRRQASNSAHSPPWRAQYPPPQQAKPTSSQASYETAASYYRTPEQTPTSSMLKPSFPGAAQERFAREMRENFPQPEDRSTASYAPRPYDDEQAPPRPQSYQTGPRYSMPPQRESHHLDQPPSARYSRDEEQQHARGYGHAPTYHGSGPAFFMPSQYDYQQGKARKRSNLPKQSTEIMKTWFDQNISNPYPTEEQKAMFSNATGISMTQVSNWFINHRRRCPELRDKREKSRGSR